MITSAYNFVGGGAVFSLWNRLRVGAAGVTTNKRKGPRAQPTEDHHDHATQNTDDTPYGGSRGDVVRPELASRGWRVKALSR